MSGLYVAIFLPLFIFGFAIVGGFFGISLAFSIRNFRIASRKKTAGKKESEYSPNVTGGVGLGIAAVFSFAILVFGTITFVGWAISADYSDNRCPCGKTLHGCAKCPESDREPTSNYLSYEDVSSVNA